MADAMLPVAVDAMGGDRAPADIVAGARRAVDELGVPVVLVGRSADIGDAGGLEVIEASQVIGMHDDPARSVRTMKDSSLVRAAEAVRDGRACAMVSAGNTGATMASALLRMGRLSGVSRPAIATPIPVPGQPPTLLVDAGANADCQAEWLVQFAEMGATYSRHRYGVERPKVALLSIGEEETKGNELVKAARALLDDHRWTGPVEFVGNVEGRDLLSDAADVVVCDGFTGNVTLKTLEGSVKFIVNQVLAAFTSSDEARAAADVLLPALAPLAAELDPDTTGGAALLGVKGLCIISHGSSGPEAIVNAVRVAADLHERDVVAAIAASI